MQSPLRVHFIISNNFLIKYFLVIDFVCSNCHIGCRTLILLTNTQVLTNTQTHWLIIAVCEENRQVDNLKCIPYEYTRMQVMRCKDFFYYAHTTSNIHDSTSTSI